jgi:restriction system protein
MFLQVSTERIALFEARDLANFSHDEKATVYNGLKIAPAQTALTLTAEAVAAIKTRTCRFCSTPLTRLDHWQNDMLLVCNECGYWAGRGTRIGGPADNRVVRGVLDFIDLNEATLEQLLLSISSLPDRLRRMDPFRAEKIMADLLAEHLDCEVRPVGGRRDGGVDGYILAGDGTRSIVQVKWRETGAKGETVSVVRELAGTMLARGEPSALLVTTRNRMSKPASREMELIGEREVVGLGKLRIDAMVYQDIIDMLDLAWTRRGGDFQAVTPWLRQATDEGATYDVNRDWVFDLGGP